jgi:diguanylate cyclase (GGDEF)-like protein/PAS domain S-box-containing protein
MRAIWGRYSMRSGFWIAAALFVAILAIAPREASALEALKLTGEEERLEITEHAIVMDGQGDSLRVNTAPGLDGVVRQMSIRASTAGSNPAWMVFALRNVSDKPITRWITAQKYHLIGSRIMWPDLDAPRIEALTPSVGFLPQRVQNEFADIYRITVNPGQTITYVAELASGRARVFAWEPHAYELQALDRQLFNGIMLGVVGVLVIFLTAIFAANHRAIFPSAALVAWCALAYLCVDFGFWHKLLQLRAEDTAVYRAATEAALAASLLIFLHIFLRLGSWHGFFRMLSGVWIIAQLSLVFVAVLDPRLASTFARLSFAAIGAVGALLTLFLALRGQDRALALIPTWMLYLVWVFAAAVTLMGELNGDIVVSGLVSGLTIVVTLIGFTVTQFAFSASPAHAAAIPSEQNLRALAVDGAGAAVWEWHARRDEVKVSPVVELSLGYNHGELSTKVENFLQHLHPSDQERLRVQLASIGERKGGVLRTDFRIRHADNSYRGFELEASSISTADQRSVRCVGLLRDVTDQKRAQTRLLHDAVHDSLTGLPNRELFLDRLAVAMAQAVAGRGGRPALILIDLDKFKSVNASFGLIVGDSLLLTVARRLSRHLGPQDTLGRVGGDQFAILLPDTHEPDSLGKMAEQVRRSLRAPIRIAGQDIVLTAAVGIAVHDGQTREGADLLMDAEVAMYHAKGHGADHITVFRPEMRKQRDNRIQIESDLRRALERRQLKVLYQPIIHLPTEELAGFEALVRWEHPQLGLLNPAEFIPVAEESDLIVRLGSYVLLEAVQQAARWQDELPRNDNPVFVSVNVSSRQLFRQDLIQEIRHIIGRSIVPEGVLRLEVTESLVMENPERASEILESLRSAGAGLAMDDFGTGYSSLAYLQRFPFDTIKIDRDLTQAALDDESGAAIVRSIVALANELGKKVVAEGVEIAADVGFLRSIGCDYAQGFYYGEPMNDRAALELVRIIRKAERKRQRKSYFWAKSESQLDKAKTRAGASEETERTQGTGQKKARKAGAAPKGESPPERARPAVNGAGHVDAVDAGPACAGGQSIRAESDGRASNQYRSPDHHPAPAVAELPLRMPARPGPAPPPPPNPTTARTAPPQQPPAPSAPAGVLPENETETTGHGRAAPTRLPSPSTSPPPAVRQQPSPPPAAKPPPAPAATHAPSMPPADRPSAPVPPSDMEGLSRLSVGEAGKPAHYGMPASHFSENSMAAVVDGPTTAPLKPVVPLPELSTLPPNIASSLAKLAGVAFDPQGQPPSNDEIGITRPPRKKAEGED